MGDLYVLNPDGTGESLVYLTQQLTRLGAQVTAAISELIKERDSLKAERDALKEKLYGQLQSSS